MKQFKDNKNKFIIIRVTEQEKEKLLKESNFSKNLSVWARHKLGLDNEN